MRASTAGRMAATAARREQAPAPAHGRTIDLTIAKNEARRSLPRGDVGRELVLALPDLIDEAELDALFPTLVRVLRDRSREAQP